MSEPSPTECPACGEDGVRACVDDNGRELGHDHDGRPPFFPPAVSDVFGLTLPPRGYITEDDAAIEAGFMREGR